MTVKSINANPIIFKLKIILFLSLFTSCSPKINLNLYHHELAPKSSFMPSKHIINKSLPKVVIFDFNENDNKVAKDSGIGSTLAIEIQNAISKNGLAKIVDRKIGKKLQKEIALSQAKGSSFSYKGPIIANYAISGEISNADFIKKYSAGSVIYNEGKLITIPASFKYSASVSGSARIYEIPSMNVVQSFEFSGSAYRAENAQKQGGFLGIGSTVQNGENFDAGLVRKAAKNSISNLDLPLKNSLSQDGYIIEKRSYKDKVVFKINLGSNDKIKTGDKFEIIGKFEIINPVTEKSEIEERILATGEVSNIVNPEFSWIILDKKEFNNKIRIGDIVDFRYKASLFNKIVNNGKKAYYSVTH